MPDTTAAEHSSPEAPLATPPTEGRWEFYDEWAAFPLSRIEAEANRQGLTGRFMVGLNDPDGGTHGEFAITFRRFNNDRREHARLEAFGDSWKVLSASGLVDRLSALDSQPQGPDEIRALLLDMGMTDRTDVLRSRRPIPCPTCHGQGVLA